ncbi:MAG: hypothetical protein U1E56_02440 [Bauldia sp.]
MSKSMTAVCALALSLGASILAPSAVQAEGNLAARPTTLETLVLDGRNLGFNQKEYSLETGKYYKWQITSKGGEEFSLFFPDLFRLAQVLQIRVNTVPAGQPAQFIEVHTVGPIHHLEYDAPGDTVIFFVPISPGEVKFYAAGFENKGMTGVMKIK